jgi:nicotinate-nucleotide pyrophosphorylase
MSKKSETTRAFVSLIEDSELELMELYATRKMSARVIRAFERLADESEKRNGGGDLHRRNLSALVKLRAAQQVVEGRIAAIRANTSYYEERYVAFLESR